MKRTSQLLGAVSSIALVSLSISPAMAADLGTNAGDIITNKVTVDYKVNGVNQTTEATNDIVVDEKINVDVTKLGSTTTVVAGQSQAVLTFEVSNLSNTTVDLALSVNQSSTDQFNLISPKFYVDTNNDGVYSAGDTEVTFLEDMLEDEKRKVFVVGDIPTGLVATDTAVVNLVADAHSTAAGTGVIGAEKQQTAGANTAGKDTLLADGAGTVDNANSGDDSDANSFVVAATGIQVEKNSRVVYDPVNGESANAKAVPGAIVEYCIVVRNNGSFPATGITVNDPLPGAVTFEPDSYGASGDIVINGTVDGSGVCSGGTQTDKSYTTATTTVGNALADIAAGSVGTLYFRVKIK